MYLKVGIKGYNNISANTEITATYEEKPKEEEKAIYSNI